LSEEDCAPLLSKSLKTLGGDAKDKAGLNKADAFFFSPIAGERGAKRLFPYPMIGPR
jgi:hypothetical protein